jgi:phosphatidylglycerophosphate synthase
LNYYFIQLFLTPTHQKEHMSLYSNRRKFSGLYDSIGDAFAKIGLSPNHWTGLSLVFVIIAAYALVKGMFLEAGLLFIISSFLDVVDGAVANATGKASKQGAYIDTITDRYVEFIIILGILLVGLPAFVIPSNAWVLLALFGSMMLTYAKSAAKEKDLTGQGKELIGRIMARAERLLILIAGIIAASINPVYLTYAVAFLAVATNISALLAIRMALKRSNN